MKLYNYSYDISVLKLIFKLCLKMNINLHKFDKNQCPNFDILVQILWRKKIGLKPYKSSHLRGILCKNIKYIICLKYIAKNLVIKLRMSRKIS